MAREVVNCLEEQKGEDILLLDIHEIASFTDYFVICTGTSDRMLDNLATKVSEMVHERYGYPRMIEGRAADGWQVLDLGDVVVHLFAPDRRDYYRLEQLWEHGKVLLRLQ